METLDCTGLVRMLHAAADEVRARHELLTQLDSVGGDGDHGTTMVRAMGLMEKTAAQAAPNAIKTLLTDVGWAIMGVDGGAIGPLLGLFFAGMAEGVTDEEAVDAARLVVMLEAGLANLRKQTKAQPGDKTLLDALVPAVEAARAATDGGVCDVLEVLVHAAEAAEAGAAATEKLMAKFGRAKNIKEQSIGTADPGATSTALLFKGFVKGASEHARRG